MLMAGYGETVSNSLQMLPLGNNMLSWLQRQMGQFVFNGFLAVKGLLTPVAFGVHALLVDRDGRVLVARHSYTGGLSLPGSGVKRGEPPERAILRELREELGTIRSDPPQLVGVFTRPAGWATNVIVLYRLMNAEVEAFKPNFEIREIVFVDPANPPAATTRGTKRRLAEFVGKSPSSSIW